MNRTDPQTPSIAHFGTTAALALLLTASKIVLWRARSYAKYLEEQATNVWSDGTPLLDLSHEELHRCIIQKALQRGIDTVGTITQINDLHYTSSKEDLLHRKSANIYYQSSSSSEASNGRDVDENDCTSITKCEAIQVGGISNNKLPVLTLSPHFILKPLRLSRKTQLGARDGKNDKTKIYRGVRELAFYESVLEAASWLSLERLVSELEPLVNGNEHIRIGAYISLVRLLYRLGKPHHTMSHFNISHISVIPKSSQVVDELCLLAAYQIGDQYTLSVIKSCISSWYCFAKEQLDLMHMAEFIPPYSGLVDVKNPSQNTSVLSIQQPHLILRDITSSFIHPNIIDIKMGTQTYEPDAPKSKQLRETQKYPMQSEFGFRIVGMRVYDPATGNYRYWDKSFGTKLLTRRDCNCALKAFFQCGKGSEMKSTSLNVVSYVARELIKIKEWLEYNTTLAFYASSILIAYEGSICTDTASNPVLKIIDFTHVCRRIGGDPGYIKGVEHILSILSEITVELNTS
ncbi:hypothetical protein ACHAXN_007661 [Cyclotella atomus]